MINEETTKEIPKNRLTLVPVPGKEGLFEGIKSNGVKYTVRKDRHAYFFPDLWNKLINIMDEDHAIFFEGLIQTGARIEEWINVRPKDFDWERRTLTLYVTKVKAKKGQSKVLGGASRSFQVSSQYIRKIRAIIRKHKIKDDQIIFQITKQGAFQHLRGKLKKLGIDYWKYSLHNIRKTTGMYLKTLQHRGRDLDISEICMRLGHDHNTFLKHYGSPSIFTDQDRDKMVEIMGDVYGLK